jgi:hypothetical protein
MPPSLSQVGMPQCFLMILDYPLRNRLGRVAAVGNWDSSCKLAFPDDCVIS